TVLYWLVVIMGAIDIDGLDIDIDLDGLDGISGTLLSFVYIKELPFTIFISCWSAICWFFAMTFTYYINPERSLFLGLCALPVIVIIGIIASRFILYPIRHFFASLKGDEHEKDNNLIGRIASVETTTINSTFGRVQVESTSSPILVGAVCEDGTTLNRGDKVVIIEYQEDKDKFLVSPFNEN
ncbi:MAG: NfeD family protein, partial [Planctomycetes bacterium]|nr:NfeD family protein [Planctomycetota bacterium]